MSKMLPYTMTYGEYSAIYNSLSFVMASMGASTVYFFFHAQLVRPQYRTAICISALVTLIAFYHYFRIFDSFNASYAFAPVTADSTDYVITATGIPFNDAYRYMDWLLTVPLLLLELVLVMKLDDERTTAVSTRLGVTSALMIAGGYPGEISGSYVTRGIFLVISMSFFLYIIYELFVGLAAAVSEQPEAARGLVSAARYVTIISWLTYPVVYIFPFFTDLTSPSAMLSVQIGYSISDFVSKCVVGLMIVMISQAKSGDPNNFLLPPGSNA